MFMHQNDTFQYKYPRYINASSRAVNPLRKHTGRFRRFTATRIPSLLRQQQPRQAALLRLLPSLLLLAACAVLLDSLVPIPLWLVTCLIVALGAYVAHSCEAFVASQRRKSTLRHLVRSCLLRAS